MTQCESDFWNWSERVMERCPEISNEMNKIGFNPSPIKLTDYKGKFLCWVHRPAFADHAEHEINNNQLDLFNTE